MGFTTVEATLKALDETVRAAAERGLLGASDDIQSTARDAVREWRTKVDFEDEITKDERREEILITPKGDGKKIFEYVDLGTKGPYPIPKVLTPDSKMLVFQTGYSARTQPIAKYNQGSGEHFGAWVQKKQVLHPGIKGREFLVTFMKELIPTLQQRVQKEITDSIS